MVMHPWYTQPTTRDIRWDTGRDAIIAGGKLIQFTPTEYRLLTTLKHGKAVTYADITYIVYRCDVDAHVRIMLDKHIDRIRSKMKATGFYVHCVLNYGYVLLPRDSKS